MGTQKKRRVGIYTRISLDREKDSTSPERQEALCRQLAAAYGWDVLDVYVDRDLSGWKTSVKRPEYERMLADVQSGRIDAVMAYSLSRLGRRATRLHLLAEELKEQGASLVLYDLNLDTGTAAGKMFFALMAALAEMEAEQTSERVKSAHQVAAQKGGMHLGGSRCFGYARDPETKEYLGVDPQEAAVVRDVYDRVMRGDSLGSIARDLNAQGVKTGGGKAWYRSTVRQMIASPRLAGIRQHRDERLPGAWEGILTPDQHYALLDFLNRPPTARQPIGSHLLTGLGRCGECKRPLRITSVAHPTKDPDKPRFFRYQCVKDDTGNGCGKVSGSKTSVEETVLDHLFTFLSSADLRPGGPGGDRTALAAELEAVKVQQVEVAKQRFAPNSPYGGETLDAVASDLARREEELRLALAELDRKDALASTALRPGERADLEAWWEAATPEEKKATLRYYVAAVDLTRAKHRGGNKFDRDRVKVRWTWAGLKRAATEATKDFTEADWERAAEEAAALAEV